VAFGSGSGSGSRAVSAGKAGRDWANACSSWGVAALGGGRAGDATQLGAPPLEHAKLGAAGGLAVNQVIVPVPQPR
jgi:hypothetical protein